MMRFSEKLLPDYVNLIFYLFSFCVGTVDFNLSAMPLPVNDADKCTLDQVSDGVTEVETDDLFKRKRMKGWWPVYEVDKEGTRLLNVS